MSDDGSSVTLIFYALDKRWWSTGSEPFLNLVAAAAQFSKFTHVELAIGEDSGARGEMINVLRIFNDDTGVVTWAPPIPPHHPTPPPPPSLLLLTGAYTEDWEKSELFVFAARVLQTLG